MSQDENTQSYAAGWYADTANPGTERFYDGAAWTQQTRTTASAPTIPLEAPVPTAAVFAADWYPDSAHPGTERFYDGAAWTAQTRPALLPTQVLGTGATFGARSKKRKWPWIVGGVVAVVILVPAMSAAMNRDKVQEGFESAQQDKPAAVVEEPAAEKQPAAEVVATTVPDVLGITAREARALIENAGLEVEYQANKGVVLDQDNWTVTGTTPGAGAALNTGDIVVVQVTKTAELNQAAAPVAPAEPAEPAPPQYTLAQENALESAQSYLAYSGLLPRRPNQAVVKRVRRGLPPGRGHLGGRHGGRRLGRGSC